MRWTTLLLLNGRQLHATPQSASIPPRTHSRTDSAEKVATILHLHWQRLYPSLSLILPKSNVRAVYRFRDHLAAILCYVSQQRCRLWLSGNIAVVPLAFRRNRQHFVSDEAADLKVFGKLAIICRDLRQVKLVVVVVVVVARAHHLSLMLHEIPHLRWRLRMSKCTQPFNFK